MSRSFPQSTRTHCPPSRHLRAHLSGLQSESSHCHSSRTLPLTNRKANHPMSTPKKPTDIPKLPVLSTDHLLKIEAEWANSPQKRRLDEFRRRVQAKIELLNVGSFIQIARPRNLPAPSNDFKN